MDKQVHLKAEVYVEGRYVGDFDYITYDGEVYIDECIDTVDRALDEYSDYLTSVIQNNLSIKLSYDEREIEAVIESNKYGKICDYDEFKERVYKHTYCVLQSSGEIVTIDVTEGHVLLRDMSDYALHDIIDSSCKIYITKEGRYLIKDLATDKQYTITLLKECLAK